MTSQRAEGLGRERLLVRLRRWRVGAAPLLRWTVLYVMLLAPTIVGLFLWVAIVDGGWQALGLLTGTRDAQNSDVPLVAAGLVIAGWLAIPTVVGALVGIGVERQIERERGASLEQIQRKVIAAVLRDADLGPTRGANGPSSSGGRDGDASADKHRAE